MITRKNFLRVAGTAGVAAFSSVVLAACEGRGASDAAPASVAETVDAPADEGTAVETSDETASPATTTGDSIVVYFSRAGENYGVGVVEQGNTAIVAEMIAAKTGSDTFEIKPEAAYPEDYDECCDVALEEQNAGARPAYAGDVDLARYATVYLGYPIWWGDLPMCVYTFLEAHDWTGKEIRPFCTHAGSGVAGTDASLAAACAGAEVGDALSVAGTTAQNDRSATEDAVDAWL